MKNKTTKEEALVEFTDHIQEKSPINGFGSTKWPDVNVADLAADFGVTNGNPTQLGGADYVYRRKVITKHLLDFVKAGQLHQLHLIRFESTGELSAEANDLLTSLLGVGLVNQHLIVLQKGLIEKATKATKAATVPWYKRIFRRKTKS